MCRTHQKTGGSRNTLARKCRHRTGEGEGSAHVELDGVEARTSAGKTTVEVVLPADDEQAANCVVVHVEFGREAARPVHDHFRQLGGEQGDAMGRQRLAVDVVGPRVLLNLRVGDVVPQHTAEHQHTHHALGKTGHRKTRERDKATPGGNRERRNPRSADAKAYNKNTARTGKLENHGVNQKARSTEHKNWSG